MTAVNVVPTPNPDALMFRVQETLVPAGTYEYASPEKAGDAPLAQQLLGVNGIELIVTWNFAHINNPSTRLLIRRTVENAGYECPEICSPDELLESET